MRTENSTPPASPWDRLRPLAVRARRALASQGPAYRWTLGAAALAMLAAIGYLATPSSSPTGFVASGRHFATDEVNQIAPELAAKHIGSRVDAQGRVEVSADRLDEADAIVAKLRVGPPSIEALTEALSEGSPFDLDGTKQQREKKAREAVLAAMIRQLDGVVWAYVTINRPKATGGVMRPAASPKALVYLQTEGDRPISYKTVQSILSYIVGSETELKHDAVTICDVKGRRYLDPFDPKLSAVSRTKAREEELGQDILEQLDNIKGVRVTVQLIAAPPPPAPAPPPAVPAPAAPPEPADDPALPEPAVAVNQPVELPPEPADRPATAPAPTAAAPPAAAPLQPPQAEKARVWVRVPNSYYLKALGKRNPSEEDIRPYVQRTEQIVRTAVAYVFPPNEPFEVTIDAIPDGAGADAEGAHAPAPDARRPGSWWVTAGVTAAVAAGAGVALALVLAARRPAARRSRAELRGRYKVDVGPPEPGPAPSERVRELIRLNPESAATVLNRWIGQEGGGQ